MKNPLADIIPATWRRYLYAAFGLCSLIVGALTVARVDVGTVDDVLLYLGGALGLTAASNVTSPGGDMRQDAPDEAA